MALAILVSGIEPTQNGTLYVNGVARSDAFEDIIGWGVEVAWTATNDEINAACMQAAIDACAALQVTVDVNAPMLAFNNSGSIPPTSVVNKTLL